MKANGVITEAEYVAEKNVVMVLFKASKISMLLSHSTGSSCDLGLIMFITHTYYVK